MRSSLGRAAASWALPPPTCCVHPAPNPCPASRTQVHDIDGGLERVQQLLRKQGGFSHVVAEQPADLQGTTVYNVYATRRT